MHVNAPVRFMAQLRAKDPAESVVVPERRKRPRTSVHWPIQLSRAGMSAAIRTTTQNLSNSGFYCLSASPMTPGESLVCRLTLPAHDPRREEETITLECTALVMRAEATADGLYGIACRIEEYHLAGHAAES